MMTLVASKELGATYITRNHTRALEEQDFVYEALIALQSRACRISQEVYALLSSGLALGALSRRRTLHEIAVNSIIIADHGRRDSSDIAERFLHHGAVSAHKEAQIYQDHCEALGCEPYTSRELNQFKTHADEMIKRCGNNFRKTYGWAEPIFGYAPNFRELEHLADLSRLRGYYAWASHEVHSDATSANSNVIEWNGENVVMTGPVSVGLATPGHLALISLNQCNTSLVFAGTDHPRVMDILAVK